MIDINNRLEDYDKLNSDDKKVIENLFCDKKFISFIDKYISNENLKIKYEYNFADLFQEYDVILNLKKLNQSRYINSYLERRNKSIKNKGFLIGNFTTHSHIKNLFVKKFPFLIGYLVFIIILIFDTLSKLSIIKSFYFFLKKYKIISKTLYGLSTFGKGRLISRAEVFGRLYSCGYEVTDFIDLDFTIFFVAKKIKEPDYNLNPSFSFLIKLRRVGINNKIFNVYKFRTMRPYSEYLQKYMYENFALRDGGKIKNDFRVSYFGSILRKFWIDELPMIINVLRGEMKIVGVRPLSEHYFGLYTDEAKNKRIKFKPGLIPPFYADLPKTLEEIIASELNYLNQYEKEPFKTDVKYFFKCMFNIFFKGARSA